MIEAHKEQQKLSDNIQMSEAYEELLTLVKSKKLKHMYFDAKISIDPSQLTKIEVAKPTKAFGKLLYLMSGGSLGKKVERETFTAISILQQLNGVLRNQGITNIVRLSQDDIDYYLDTEGKRDDLQEALDSFDLEINEALSTHFKTLNLILEHETEHLKYLIDLKISRSHDIGEYPIAIHINGILKDFKVEKKNVNAMKERMKRIFKDKEQFNIFRFERQTEFEGFVNQLAHNIHKFMKVDDVVHKVKQKVVIPKEKVKKPDQMRENKYADDMVYHNYYGHNDFFMYAFLWSNMCHDHNIVVSDTHLYTPEGEEIGHIGEEGVDAGEASIFDPEADFDAGVSEISDMGMDATADFAPADSTSDWSFGGDSDSSSGCSDGGSGCSDGGGCSSGCGGGCGGCGGCG